MILYIFGHYDKAMEVGHQLVPQMNSLWSMRCTRVVFFYASLAITARLREDPSLQDQREDLLRLVEEYRARIVEWQSYTDANYLMWSLLIQAEVSELRNDLHEATQAYEAAIDHAQLYDLHLELALILENQGAFFVRRGARRAAIAMIRDAMAAYSRLGATGKVNQMATKNEFLLNSSVAVQSQDAAVQTANGFGNTRLQIEEHERQEMHNLGEETTNDRTKAWVHPSADRPVAARHISNKNEANLGLDILDLTSILEFSQAISSELDIDKLLVKMTEIIVSSAGSAADLVQVVTERDDAWCIAASGNLDGISAFVSDSTTTVGIC